MNPLGLGGNWWGEDASRAWVANSLKEEIARLKKDARSLRNRPRIPGAGEYLASAYEAAAHTLETQLYWVEHR